MTNFRYLVLYSLRFSKLTESFMASNIYAKSTGLIFALFLFLINPQSISAQNYKENALLWKISGNDLKEPSYVFAIVKFIPGDEYFFPEEIEEVFNSCGILSTETLLDHHAKHELNKAAHLDHGQTLENIMSEDDYKKLEDMFINRFGVSKLKFDLVYKKFKPIMISTTITRLALGEPMKYYEPELVSRAQSRGMITMGLETVEREVEALESFKLEDQVSALSHSINNFDEQLEDYQQIVAAFKEENLHKMLEYTLHPVENNEEFRDNFIVNRNREWIPKMVEYMHMAPTFFAIGASHVADESGVLHLLELQGYKVEPIR